MIQPAGYQTSFSHSAREFDKIGGKSNGMRQALTDLDKEARKGEGILPHEDSPSVPNQFTRAAPEYGKQECPGLVFDPQHQMDGQCKAKKRNEGGVGC